MKKSTSSKKYHLLAYVENSSSRLKKFNSLKALNKFVHDFNKKYPDHLAVQTGYWIDYCITGITGDVVVNNELSIKVS